MKTTVEGLPRRTSLWAQKVLFCFCTVLLSTHEAKVVVPHGHATMSVSPPHLYYNCPEGATAKLVCQNEGTMLDKNDVLWKTWFFTPHTDHSTCPTQHPRHLSRAHFHGNHTLPPGVELGSSEHEFWMTLHSVTHADQGRYCCVVVEAERGHHHHDIKQTPHSSLILTISPRRNGSVACTIWDPTTSGGSVAVALAIAACILALLSLPLILVLVYKQRYNGHSSRRAQELVRMDSEAHGHENPVFLGGSPQSRTRTVSQILTRQSSETGRHLLSDPGTPLSPPAHGDVFFPVEDTIPESPDLL